MTKYFSIGGGGGSVFFQRDSFLGGLGSVYLSGEKLYILERYGMYLQGNFRRRHNLKYFNSIS